MTIPALLDKQVVEVIRQWKQDIRDQEANNGNVQILENMVGACKKQLVALSEEGVRKMQQFGNQAEREKAEESGRSLLRLYGMPFMGKKLRGDARAG